MAFEVRPARLDDVAGVITWTTDTFDWGDYIPERLPAWIEDPESLVVVGVDETDRAVSVSHALMVSSTEAWLEGARVHPEHKRSGLGSAMNRACVEWARQQGARVARLAVDSENTAARRQVEGIDYRVVSSWAFAAIRPDRRVDRAVALTAASSADVDAAWLSWAASELSLAGRELRAIAWRWRTARPEDLHGAARRGELFQSPSGWVIVEQPDADELRTGWMAVTPEDAPSLIDGMLDLGSRRGVSEVSILAPWLPWVTETMARAGAEPSEVLIYGKGL